MESGWWQVGGGRWVVCAAGGRWLLTGGTWPITSTQHSLPNPPLPNPPMAGRAQVFRRPFSSDISTESAMKWVREWARELLEPGSGLTSPIEVRGWWVVGGGWWVWLRLHCIVPLRRSAVIATTIVKLTPNLRP